MRFARPIVIDTGILVSAAIRAQSLPALALERALLDYEVYASVDTLTELQQVLMRQKFDRYLSVAQRQNFLNGLPQRFWLAAHDDR